MSDIDKAIRAAKLTLGGILEKNRAKEARERAPGQIAPSKYMPNVPRQVHAFGGYVPAPMVQNAPRLAVAKAPRQAPQQEADFLASMQSLTDTAKSFTGKEEAPATAPEPHAARAEPHGYGEGISSDAAKAMAGLQAAWGGQDFGIVSGYRDPKENEAAKGAKNSQHLHGNAFDVDTTGWSEEDKLALADAAWEQGFRGFGFYDNNMHFDVGDPRGWGPSYSRDSIPSWAQDWTANRYGYADGGKIGGKDAFLQGNHPLVPEVLYHGSAPSVVAKSVKLDDGKWTKKIDQEATDKNIASQDFREFRQSSYGNYGPGIYLSDKPNVASDYAQGVRADQTEVKPYGQVLKLNVSMKQPFHDDVLRNPGWKDYIKKALTRFWLPGGEERDGRDAFLKKLDDGTATVRDMFLRDTPQGTMVNQWGHDEIHDTIRNSGFDGIIAHRPDGSKEYVAFKPEQVKSAISAKSFDPTDPDMTKSEGGGIGDNDNFANWFGNSVTHTDGEPHVFYTGTSKDKDFTSFNVGRHGAWFTRDPAEASSYAEQNDSQDYKMDGWKMVRTNTASRVIPAYVKAENPYTGPLPPETMRDNYKAAQSDWFDSLRAKGHDAWIPADQGGNLVVALKEPHQIKSVYNSGKFDPNQKHMNKAEGGPIMTQEQIEREMPSQPGGGQRAQDALDAVSKAGRIGGLVGRASGVPLGNIVGRKIAEQIAMSGYADGGAIGDAPDIQNPMSIFPKPQRMFPEDQRPPGGQYLSMPNKSDVTGHKAETAHIGVGLDGKPFFRASQNAVDQTGSTGSGTANVKTNLFKQKAGWRWSQAPEGHENTQTIVSVEHRGKHYYALNAHFPKGVDLARYENATSEPRLRPTTRGNVDLGPQAGSITVRGREHPVYHHVIVKADGGAVERASGGRTITDHGLYSRAAEIIRGLPQEKGTVDQYIAAAKKLGAKPSEIEHAGRPEGDKISREDMAKHFDKNLPKMEVHQYGENPSYLSKEQEKRLYEMWNKPKSEAEQAEYDLLMRRTKGPQVKYETDEMTDENEPRPTEYHDYNLPGGSNYRERLLTLPSTNGKNDYMSNHWSDDSNVLAHIRMSDRTMGGDRESMRPVGEKLAQRFGVSIRDLSSGSALTGVKEGLITPEEGATFSRFMRWNNGLQDKPGLDKRVLHVEEMQSDWGQEGREKGFYDPKNPYEIFNTKTGETVSKHPSQDAMWDAYRAIPEDQSSGLDYGHARYNSEKKPAAPYVQNTQHWTDLALKNILHEAAMGGYDHIVFTPGQAQADRYGLEKKLSRIELRRPSPDKIEGSRLLMYGLNGNQMGDAVQVKDEDHLRSLIGSDVSGRLMQAPGVPGYNVSYGNHVAHTVQGDDLKAGGQGMKGYYDNILPKSVMRLAQQHDEDIKPGTMELPEGHTGFSIPMTDKLKQGVLGGQTAFKRGGTVEKADGGSTNGQQDTAGTSQARPEAGGLPVAGGVRGSSGVLPSQGETPLEGLPTNIRIPLTGGSLQAGPDPRIREIARQYMASSGLPYNPPTKYAKVDPGRSKRIAAAYDAMTDNPDDPLTKASYNALAKETMAQYQAAKAAGFKAEFWHPGKQEDPYKASPRLAVEDVRNNHHMWVYPTYAGYGSGEITEEDVKKNPMLQGTGEHWNGIPVTVNDVFRAIHDYYGHAKEGVGFRADGEENAWRAHASMFSPLARMAMTSETRGQNSWLNYGPHGEANRGARTEDTIFAPQKVGIMPDWVHHEGAEDFVTPEDVAELKRVRAKHGVDFEKALGITRSFTKDGKAATMKLKLKD